MIHVITIVLKGLWSACGRLSKEKRKGVILVNEIFPDPELFKRKIYFCDNRSKRIYFRDNAN